MKRYVVISAVLSVLILAGSCLYYGFSQETIVARKNYSTWQPDAAAVRAKIGTSLAPTAGMTDSERHDQYVTMFKSRYRDHDPAYAVGIRFMSPTVVKLMCPARMEPWEMDDIALQLWHETQETFGQNYDVDIYETFIGTTPVRIGKLRAHLDNPKIADISYSYPAKVLFFPGASGLPHGATRPTSRGNSVPPGQAFHNAL